MQDFRTCQAHIRRIAEQSKALLATRPRDPAEAELKRIDLIMAANVQTALATRVQDLSTTFRKKQANYLRRGSSCTSQFLRPPDRQRPLTPIDLQS